MNKLISNLIISYSSSLIGFLVVIASARILGAEEYYWMALGIAIGGFIIPLTNLGSDRTFVRDAIKAENPEEVEEIVTLSLSVRVTFALAISVCMFIWSYLYFGSILNSIAITSISAWVGIQGLYPASWYDFVNATRRQNGIVLIERLFCVGIVVWVYFMPELIHVTAVLGVLLLTSRLASVIVQIRVWWLYQGSRRLQLKFILPRPGMPGINYRVTLTLLANTLLTFGNQLILAGSAPAVEFAAYSLAFQIVSMVFLFQTLAIRLLSRNIAEACNSGKGIIKSMVYKGMLMALGSALMAFCAYIVILFFPAILDDNRFVVAVAYMPVLCLWITIVGAGQVVTQHLLALGQETIYFATGIIGGGVAFFLGFLFVPEHGAYAVAVILLLIHSGVIAINTFGVIYMTNMREEF